VGSLFREGAARRKPSPPVATQARQSRDFHGQLYGVIGLKNGELLKVAEEAGFDVFVTGDKTLSYEQNLTGLRIAMLVLSTTDRDILKGNAHLIAAALDNLTPGSVQQVDCGTFSRKKPNEE
jgi:hypothetical protein